MSNLSNSSTITDVPQERVRNFAIIAHIDHGKSTLADRMIQLTGTLSEREMKDQVLDSMELERERGITIKSNSVRIEYTGDDGDLYALNLIDTPGHVDFAYEVSRSLSACEGSILLVDASQGVEAQTLANVYLALDNNHEIIPVLNKIDLPAAEPEQVKEQIEEVIGLDTSDSLAVSGKTGAGVPEVLQQIIDLVPAPGGDPEARTQALLVDAWYDAYLGVIILVRVMEGTLRKGQKIRLMDSKASYDIDRIGVFRPERVEGKILKTGELGYITAGIKNVSDCQIGDTITDERKPAHEPLAGFKPSVPVVFCGLYPSDAAQFDELRNSLERLALNDASFHFETESSAALGFGFRCGFLGLLHLEIIQERLSREFNLDLVTTAPSVVYNLHLTDGTQQLMHNPVDMPEVQKVDFIEEPWIKATILVPDDYLGPILKLCEDRRGIQKQLTYAGSRAMLEYELPLNEVVFDFYDRLKSVSRGYASFNYEPIGNKEGDLVKVNILVNQDPIDALALMVHRTKAESRGRQLCEKLKELIPRQLFKIAIQAAIGGKVIARETVSALRKDVTAKCYGGDATRKKKLLEKQKEGKKRMRSIGNVDIPQSAFIAALKMDS
ncbi:MAG: translation elongation factor 4 [Alphaproteobacteria bacterium]